MKFTDEFKDILEKAKKKAQKSSRQDTAELITGIYKPLVLAKRIEIGRPLEFRYWDQQKNRMFSTRDLPRDLVQKHPVMQCTGFKDKNGVKVFEADILDLDEDMRKIRGGQRRYVLVGYHHGGFMYGRSIDPTHMDTYLWMDFCDKKKPEVVGNVFENHLLLFSKEDMK